jgi:hypothetical protein
MAKIQFVNKEAFRISQLPEKNKVTAQNLNEIKSSVNFLYDKVDEVESEIITSFTGLSDTPSSYTGQGGKAVFVKSDASGLEFQTLSADNLFTANLTLGANRTHDMNGNSMTFLKSNVEFRASGGLSSGRVVTYRDYTNSSDLASISNDGIGRIVGGWHINNGGIIRFGIEVGQQNYINNSFGTLFLHSARQLVFQNDGLNLAYSQTDSDNFFIKCNNSVAPDGAFANNFINFSVDEVNDLVTFKVRKSDGTFLTKTL